LRFYYFTDLYFKELITHPRLPQAHG